MKKTKWTIEKIKEGMESFHKEYAHYPTSIEIDHYAKLPSSRQIQRLFGGLPALRKLLNFKGQPEDFTKGEYSSARAKMIGERAHKVEKEVYTYLVSSFGEPFVHREYFFTDDKRNRTDFYIYHKGGNFSVDVFYPKDQRCLSGCLNSKLKNYSRNPEIKYPVVFLMMNKEISEEVLQKIIERKKIKLSSYQSLVSFDQFKKFCAGKSRLNLQAK
ncbi:MAG: hypothetical protein WCT02_04430 [Candidatus Paceibacterota bacterium]